MYNNVEGDVVYQAATGKGYERSSNKSSGYGVGVYADSKSQGFTVNANTAKGYGNGETTTNANSHVTVGGTTYQNIGGDLVLDGAVVKGDHMSGHIDGAILAKSRPDTATYTGKQTNAGVSADIGFDGVPQSVSVNAGRSKVNADYAAVTGMAGKSDVTTATVSSLNKPLENSFDKTTVEAQLGAQVQVSQAFDTERRTYRLEMAQDEQKLRKEAKEALEKGDEATWRAKTEQANKQQEEMVLFDSITGAIYGPNTNGVTGYVARAVAPRVSYQIGQYFKGTNGEGTAPHILAHGILAAAVSAATGNDPTIGALSAMGAEAGAKYVANYLYPGVKPSDLTAEQKATVSSIMSLAGLGVGATTGDVGSAVSAGEAAKTAVEDNLLSPADQKKLLELYSKAEKEEGFLGIGKYKLSLDDSINLTNLAILDQVGNGLISKYKANPKSLTADELTVLNKILNYYYSNGGKLEDIANLFKPGSSMSNDYLLRKGINGTQEEIFIQAANTRRIQSAVEENARMGGDAVWAAPGGFMNIVRGVVGSATVASGIKDVQNGKKGEGAFKIVGGSLMFVPINGKSGVAVNSPSFATLINNSGREINLVVKNRGSIPSNIETQSLIAEHSKQNVAPLTQAGVNTIYDNVIPNGTYAKVAGDNVAGPDVFVYSQHAGVVVDTIQFKAASGLRSVENNIKDDLKKPLSYTQGSNIIAVQVPAGGEASNALRLQNKLGNISRSSAGNRQIIIVDSNGKLLIPLQPLRNFSKK